MMLFEEVLEGRRLVLGAGHKDTLAAMCSLVELHTGAREYSDSIFYMEEVLEERRRAGQFGHAAVSEQDGGAANDGRHAAASEQDGGAAKEGRQ